MIFVLKFNWLGSRGIAPPGGAPSLVQAKKEA